MSFFVMPVELKSSKYKMVVDQTGCAEIRYFINLCSAFRLPPCCTPGEFS